MTPPQRGVRAGAPAKVRGRALGTWSLTAVLALSLFGALSGTFGTFEARAANVSFNLHGQILSTPRGWGLDATSITSPGPTLTVNLGDVVTMHLFSEDGAEHDWLLDYDGDQGPDAGEPHSPTFTSTLVPPYVFTADRPGTFTYWCFVHLGFMFGTWITKAGPSIVFTTPAPGTSWTGGSAHSIEFDVTDDEPLANLTMWVNYTSSAGSGPIAGPSTPSAANSIPWTVPAINATDVRINVTTEDASGAVASTESAAFEIDTAPPAVTSHSPTAGQAGVALNTQVVVVFSEGMSRTETEAPASFGLLDVAGNAWAPGAFGWSGDSRILTFTPGADLQPTTTYRVHVNETAPDDADPGLGLAAPTSWTFETGTVADTTPPSIASVAAGPPSQVEGGPVNITADVTDDVGVVAVTARVTGPTGFDVTLTLAPAGGTIWYANRTYATKGLYTIAASAEDAAGNADALGGSFSIVDVTAPPGPASAGAVARPEGGVRVTWSPVAAADLAGYHVYRADLANGTLVRLTSAILLPSATPEFIDTTAVPGHTYRYVVTAIDLDANESSFSPEATVTVPTPAPSAGDLTLILIALGGFAVVGGAALLSLVGRRRKKAP